MGSIAGHDITSNAPGRPPGRPDALALVYVAGGGATRPGRGGAAAPTSEAAATLNDQAELERLGPTRTRDDRRRGVRP